MTVREYKLTNGTPEQRKRWAEYYLKTPKLAEDCKICWKIPVYRGTQQQYHDIHHLDLGPSTRGTK